MTQGHWIYSKENPIKTTGMVSYKSVFLEIEKKKNPNLITAFALFFTPLLTQPETAAKAKGKQDLEAK